MNSVSLFQRLPSEASTLTIYWQGVALTASSDDTVASALLAAGIRHTRHSAVSGTAVSGTKRAPFCMMGSCFECLVELEGITLQACMLPVSPGMRLQPSDTRSPLGIAPGAEETA